MRYNIPEVDINVNAYDKQLCEECNGTDEDNTPIRRLAVHYDAPHEIVNRLIGEDESETQRLISIFESWLAAYTERISTPSPDKKPMRRGKSARRFVYDIAPDGYGLVPNPHEQRIIAFIHDLRDHGMTVREIARELTRRGCRTQRGNTVWSRSSVSEILKREPACSELLV